MKITSQILEKFSLIKFEIDQVLGYEAQEFQDAILDSLDKNVSCIIVDLSSVMFISSWGIGMLIHGLTTTKNRGGEFKIVCNTDSVLQVFKKVKIDSVLDIYSTSEEAIS